MQPDIKGRRIFKCWGELKEKSWTTLLGHLCWLTGACLSELGSYPPTETELLTEKNRSSQ